MQFILHDYLVPCDPPESPPPLPQLDLKPGTFRVGETGEVSVNFLFDGGAFQGELAFFSLEGMEKFKPGSEEFMREAVRRSLSNSPLGHVVISDKDEGAKFSGELGEPDYNSGCYQGVKTFEMQPGTEFAAMLVPNGRVRELLRQGTVCDSLRPLFSLEGATSGTPQMADVTGAGQIFAWEDLRLSDWSDRDYNDVIFRVSGASGNAPFLSKVINGDRDWILTDLGQKIISESTIIAPPCEPPRVPKQGFAPINFQFSNQKFYTLGNTFQLTGKVFDKDGWENFDRIDFWLKTDNDQWLNISDAVEFSQNSKGWATFSYDLPDLTPGHYEIRGIAYDKNGNTSNAYSQEFTFLSTPDVKPYTNSVLFSLEQATNLDNYKPEDLESARHWVISINQGEDPNLIATLLGATNLGATGLLPNTYIWEFPEGIDAYQVERLLKSYRRNIEYGYPLIDYIPISYWIPREPNDPLFYQQWHLNNTGLVEGATLGADVNILPAWNINISEDRKFPVKIRGNKVVIGIVDDGVEFNHPDLNDLYRTDLSDFHLTTYFPTAPKPDIFTILEKGWRESSGKFLEDWEQKIPNFKNKEEAYSQLQEDASQWLQQWFEANKKWLPDYFQPDACQTLWESVSDRILKPWFDQNWESLQSGEGEALNQLNDQWWWSFWNWVWMADPSKINFQELPSAKEIQNTKTALSDQWWWSFWNWVWMNPPADITPDVIQEKLAKPLDEQWWMSFWNWVWMDDKNLPSADIQQQIKTTLTEQWWLSFWNWVWMSPPSDSSSEHDRQERIRTVLASLDEQWWSSFWNWVWMDDPSASTSPLKDQWWWSFWNWLWMDDSSLVSPNAANPLNDLKSNAAAILNEQWWMSFWNWVWMDDLQEVLASGNLEKIKEKLTETLNNQWWSSFWNWMWMDDDRLLAQRIPNVKEIKENIAESLANLSFNQQLSQSFWNYIWTLESDPNQPLLVPFRHGTAVAGVAAATSNNQTGIAGAAPKSELASVQLLNQMVSDWLIGKALTYKNSNPQSIGNDIDIYNSSWKPGLPLIAAPLAMAALGLGATEGRPDGQGQNLGNIYVFAAGNERLRVNEEGKPLLENVYALTVDRDGNPLLAEDGRPYLNSNVNYNAFANSRYAIAVGAIAHDGIQSWYSEPGASLLISAYSSGKGLGITTADIAGIGGYDEGDYTNKFGGTSSAAPLVSGIIALMLQANPKLTQRDIQHILVESADRSKINDPDAGWSGKETDAIRHSHKYGFGVIDAEAAVKAAISWNGVEPEVSIQSAVQHVGEAIPDRDSTGVSSTIRMNKDINVEWVEVMFDADHPARGDLEIVLVSPDGTESILAEPHGDTSDNYDKWVFSSVRHWGESSQGDWTLKVRDRISGETGTWNNWKLNIYGTEKVVNQPTILPTITIEATDATADEGGNPGEFTITRTGSTAQPLTVTYAVGGTATLGSDYIDIDITRSVNITGSVTIPAGASSVKIPISPINDSIDEGDETVEVILAADSNYKVGSQSSAQVTIEDDDESIVTIAATDPNATEDGNAGQFIVTRTGGDITKPLTVKYSVAGTATNGTDYLQLIGTVTIPAGMVNAMIPVIPIKDYQLEPDETVTVSLTDTAKYDLGNDVSAAVTIANSTETSWYGPFVYVNPANGHLYMFSQPDTWLGAQEQAKALGGNLVTINDESENDWLLDIFVGLQLRGPEVVWMGLTDSEIYGATEGNFKWVSGEPVTYTDWLSGEPNNLANRENFGTFFKSKWNDALVSYEIPGIIEIDPAKLNKPIVNIMVTDGEAGENGNAGQIIINRIGNLNEALTVKYNVAGSATNGLDYQELNGTITIPAGASLVTIPIIPLADNLLEGDEKIAINLAADSAYKIGTKPTGEITIIDDPNPSSTPASVYINPTTGHKYLLTTPDTWLGAQEQAKALGGNLVAIDDASENSWLVDTFGGTAKWIGLTDSPIYGATEGNYKWVNGQSATYINWNPPEPNNALVTPEGEDFGEMYALWNDMPSNQDWIRQGIVEIP
ncbi:MAG: S8 family serine peptidase [Actinomycetota bacterium]